MVTEQQAEERARRVVRFLSIAPIAITILSALTLIALWQHIPEQYPIHWDDRGVVDAWCGRSINAFILSIMAAIVWSFLFGNLRTSMFDYMAPHRRFGFQLLIIGIMWEIILPLCLFQVALPFATTGMIYLLIVVTLISPFGALILFLPIWVKYSAGLSEKPPEEDTRNRDNDSHWHLGFYCNPDDPARWVEKRYGAGPTPNMAHREGKIFIAGIILFVVLIIGWVVVLAAGS